jgi:hypothetical protein
MISHRELRKTKKLIEKNTNLLLQNTPGLLKRWGKEKAQEVVTNVMLMDAIKKVYQYEPDNDKHKYGKLCQRCKNTLRFRRGGECIHCKRKRDKERRERLKSQDIQTYTELSTGY